MRNPKKKNILYSKKVVKLPVQYMTTIKLMQNINHTGFCAI